jgi:hypothetical protein
MVGKEGFEPSRLSARDPKSRLSANSSTSPRQFLNLACRLYVRVDQTSIIGYNRFVYNSLPEVVLSRVINPNTAGKQRTQLLRGIALALRELALQDQPDGKTQDLVAFIILALDAINETIDQTVVAWEKRGYWLKADRFRLDWAWSENFSYRLNVGLSQQNWPEVALLAAQIS